MCLYGMAVCLIWQTKAPSPRLAVEVLFRICQVERVGFERAGFQEVWKDCKGDLSRCISTMQRTFLKHHYVSFENVRPPLTVRGYP